MGLKFNAPVRVIERADSKFNDIYESETPVSIGTFLEDNSGLLSLRGLFGRCCCTPSIPFCRITRVRTRRRWGYSNVVGHTLCADFSISDTGGSCIQRIPIHPIVSALSLDNWITTPIGVARVRNMAVQNLLVCVWRSLRFWGAPIRNSRSLVQYRSDQSHRRYLSQSFGVHTANIRRVLQSIRVL